MCQDYGYSLRLVRAARYIIVIPPHAEDFFELMLFIIIHCIYYKAGNMSHEETLNYYALN
jgi:hypothetical protein